MQANSYLQQQTLHCSYGPEDSSKAIPACSTVARQRDVGVSQASVATLQFTSTQPAIWPDTTSIVGRHFSHITAAGEHLRAQLQGLQCLRQLALLRTSLQTTGAGSEPSSTVVRQFSRSCMSRLPRMVVQKRIFEAARCSQM